MSKVLFTGSFDPFTRGHQDIVERALRLFDGVVIALGVNRHKDNRSRTELNLRSIKSVFASEPRVEVTLMDGLAVEAARQHGCSALLRGIRSSADLEYELPMADLNRRITGGEIDTLFLTARPELRCISSSAVRELSSYGVDVSSMLPDTTI